MDLQPKDLDLFFIPKAETSENPVILLRNRIELVISDIKQYIENNNQKY